MVWGIALVAALGLSVSACKKKDEEKTSEAPTPKTTEPPKQEQPKELTAEAMMKIFDDCWAAWQAKDLEKYAGCYAADGKIEMVDSVPPRGGGAEAIKKTAQGFWAAFPDLKSSMAFVAANPKDHKMAAFYTISGTNSGPFMGMPKTDKPVAMWGAQHVVLNPDGKVKVDKHWSDGGTMMAQLGVSPNPMAPKAEDVEAPTEVIKVVTKGDEAEKKNIELLRSMEEPMKNQDLDAMAAFYADDATFVYGGTTEPAEGIEAVKKGMKEWMDMHETLAVDATDVWAAGDWVIAETTAKGTLAKDIPGAPVKTKGKEYESHYLEFFQLADGKIKKHYIFTDSSKWAADLGIMDPSKMPGAGGADDKKKEPAPKKG
jgi:steroid delta-isomerase-like uncharacterized protein